MLFVNSCFLLSFNESYKTTFGKQIADFLNIPNILPEISYIRLACFGDIFKENVSTTKFLLVMG
ncbi:MAG: hypothetical protein EOO34_00150 [Cyanobacteriota bacterium]|nr:MAG: hypothetical protein EOO34_00150 [Cyanobacteriota bacterium]